MRSFKRFLFPVAMLFAVAVTCQAEIVNLTLDPAQSDLDLSISGSAPDNSAMSGTAVLDVTSSVSPFGNAQITALDLVLDEGLTLDSGGMVTITSQPSDITITMVTPGAGGTVSGGSFDQLGNTLAMAGTMDVDDPLNLLGGVSSFDLATFTPGLIDFTGVQISRTGNTLTVSGTFLISDDLEIQTGVFVPLVANGSFVASGEVAAIPEPGTTICLIALLGIVATRRQR